MEIHSINRLMNAIDNFCIREYGEPLVDFQDSKRICIGYTNYEDHEDIEIEVCVNCDNKTLDMYVNAELTDSWYYKSFDDLAHEIETISFDELVSLGPNAEKLIDNKIGNKKKYSGTVTRTYYATVQVEVWAESEQDALEKIADMDLNFDDLEPGDEDEVEIWCAEDDDDEE